MKYVKKCECCGNQETAYTYKFNESLRSSLDKAWKKYFYNGVNPFRAKEIGLTNAQYASFHKLAYFGLIQKFEGSYWILSQKGIDFHVGKISIDETIAVLNGITLDNDHECRETHNGTRKRIMYSQDFDRRSKQKGEYVAEM